MQTDIESIRRRFIETAGHTTQSFGAGRVRGQIFAHIYLSSSPQSLDNLTRDLGISKGSASMAVRQLEQWGALRRLWIKGDRKDYYEAMDDFGAVVRKAMLDMIGRRMETSEHLLDDFEKVLDSRRENGEKPTDEWTFLEERLGKLKAFRDRSRYVWENAIVKWLLEKP